MKAEVKDLKPLFIFNGSERDIEDHIIDNINDISNGCGWGDIKIIHQQYSASFTGGRIRVDVALFHNDNTATIIEVKKNKRERFDVLVAIGQILYYGKKLSAFWGAMPRMVIASPEIDYELYQLAKDYNLPICFLMVDGNRCIYLS